MRILVLWSMLGALAACSQPERGEAERSRTAMVCDSSGCRAQERSITTFQPPATVKSEEHEALEARAVDDPEAAFDLAMRLFRGDAAIERNAYQALQWMRRAGERGNERAQLALGQLYMSGLEEMGTDLREAESWLIQAAAQGNGEAAELLEEIRPALADQRAVDRREIEQSRRRWYDRARYYWYSAPVLYYRWVPARRAFARY